MYNLTLRLQTVEEVCTRKHVFLGQEIATIFCLPHVDLQSDVKSTIFAKKWEITNIQIMKITINYIIGSLCESNWSDDTEKSSIYGQSIQLKKATYLHDLLSAHLNVFSPRNEPSPRFPLKRTYMIIMDGCWLLLLWHVFAFRERPANTRSWARRRCSLLQASPWSWGLRGSLRAGFVCQGEWHACDDYWSDRYMI